MPETATKPVYLVDAESDPVVVRIDGRACFQNSTCLRDFVIEMIKRGKTRFVLDFEHCVSMDSTFLGVLAGTALELRRSAPGASVTLIRVGPRNLDLIRNLGLHRLLKIETGDTKPAFCDTALECQPKSELETAKDVLEAHENLVKADATNSGKFQDVLAFLRNRVEQK